MGKPLAALLGMLFLTIPLFGDDSTLTNADVIKLVKLNLGDDVVVAKVNQAPVVAFKLDTGDLANLKTEGVSGRVIAAMLDRSSRGSSPTRADIIAAAYAARANAAASGSPGIPNGQDNVRLRTKSGDIVLKLRLGRRASTDIVVNTLHYFVYTEAASETRTTEARPALLVRLNDNPKASLAFIVKPEPDNKEDTRRVKVGKAGMLKSGSWSIPDEDWTVPYDATKEAPDLWRLVPKADLKPGEYGVFVRGELYAFGVDK